MGLMCSNSFGDDLNYRSLYMFSVELDVTIIGVITTPSKKQLELPIFNFYLLLGS